jgi:uncharacterized membrane protein
MSTRMKKLVSGPAWGWVALIVAATGVYGLGIAHEDFWYDEACSAAMVEHSVPQILGLTCNDVHPPLYYLLLRGFRIVLGGSDWALRLLSVFGAVGLVGLGAGPIRRMCGDATAGFYAVLTLFTPAFLIYAHEARMYTLLTFTLTACVAYGYLAVRDGRVWDWVCFGLSSLATAYLHYYGAIAVFYVYLSLGVWLLIRRVGPVRPFLMTAACVGLGYLPWLVFFLRQAMAVRRAFWIEPIDLTTVLGGVGAPFAYKFFYPTIPWSMVLFMATFPALIAFGLVTSWVRKAVREWSMILLPVVVYDGTLLTTVIVSLVFAPVFVPRYMIACFGPALIALSASIRLLPVRPLRIAVIALYVVLNAFVMKDVYTERFNGLTRELIGDLRGAMDTGDVIITSDGIAVGPLVHYLPEARHLFYVNDAEAAWSPAVRVFEPRIEERSRLRECLSTATSFWFIGTNSGFSVTGADILREAGEGWEQTAGPTDYSHPYSRFTYTVSRFARMGATDSR